MTTSGIRILQARDDRFILFGLGSNRVSWYALTILVLIYFGAIVFAAVLTPPAYWLAEWWNANAAAFVGSRMASYFAVMPAETFLFLRWLPMIVFMPMCLRWILVRPPNLVRPIGIASFRMWAYGVTAGLFLVAALVMLQQFFVPLQLRGPVHWSALLWHPVALYKGLVEQTLFSGIALSAVYTALRWPWLALVMTALFFAHEHLNRASHVVEPPVQWDTGWNIGYSILAAPLIAFDLRLFTALFAMGLVFGAATLRTRSIWCATGLHCGMVHASLTAKDLFGIPFGYHTLLSGLTEIVNGWLLAIALAFLLAAAIVGKYGTPATDRGADRRLI